MTPSKDRDQDEDINPQDQDQNTEKLSQESKLSRGKTLSQDLTSLRSIVKHCEIILLSTCTLIDRVGAIETAAVSYASM